MAVVVYACAATRQFAVVGGEEIRRLAPPAFWEQVQSELHRHFEDERYCDGLFKAIAQVAIELQRHSAGPLEEPIRDDQTGADRSEGQPPPPGTAV